MFQGEASDNLADQAKRLIELNERKKALKAELEDLQSVFNAEEEKLLLLMERDDVSSMSVDRHTIYSKETTFVSVNKECERRAHDWLKENGYDSLVRPTVNSRTLSAAYKEMLDLDIEMPTALFNINPKRSVGITKSSRSA